MRLPKVSLFQVTIHTLALAPLAWIVINAFQGDLTANPIQNLTQRTGIAALWLLVLSLAATPLNTLGFHSGLKVRRALGLYAFLYALLHFLVFTGLDYLFDPVLIAGAIIEKRYALAGLGAFLLLLPLAITSTRGWKRRLGKNWKRLHRLVYVAALLAVIHYIWLVKSDVRQPLAFGAAVLLLLMARLPVVRRITTQLRCRLTRQKYSPYPNTIGDKTNERSMLGE